jgi:hypothetical protein
MRFWKSKKGRTEGPFTHSFTPHEDALPGEGINAEAPINGEAAMPQPPRREVHSAPAGFCYVGGVLHVYVVASVNDGPQMIQEHLFYPDDEMSVQVRAALVNLMDWTEHVAANLAEPAVNIARKAAEQDYNERIEEAITDLDEMRSIFG